MTDRTQINLRIDTPLLTEIDRRIEVVNARKKRDGEQAISRNDWFSHMAKWTVTQLPHQAVRSDLIKAWPNLPEEALGIEP
jgi:hypothetical protein